MRTSFQDTLTQKGNHNSAHHQKKLNKGARKDSVLAIKNFVRKEGISLSDRIWTQIERTIETT